MRARVGGAGDLTDAWRSEDVRSRVPAAELPHLDALSDLSALAAVDEGERAATRERGRVGRQQLLRAIETNQRSVTCRDLLDVPTLAGAEGLLHSAPI
jgi:hypothetical protein